MVKSYPSLNKNWELIKEIGRVEENIFLTALDNGLKYLNKLLKNNKVISGKDAFMMHDTYGFPIDLTVEIVAEKNITVDIKSYENEMAKQKKRARTDIENKKSNIDTKKYDEIATKISTEFIGYNLETSKSQVLKILDKNQVILDKTPFYAEKGGQVADTGIIKSQNGGIFEVKDVKQISGNLIVHYGSFKDGSKFFGEKDFVEAKIDIDRRSKIRKSHTATHILQKVLKKHLGDSVSQAGSLVLPDKLRFDFFYNKKLNDETLNAIERDINIVIQKDLPVKTEVMSIDEAKKAGAIAMFDEKYGAKVRVVTIGDNWSKELCGGTHISQIGKIGRFTFVKESSIGSGIRRVEALVGIGAYERDLKNTMLLKSLGTKFNTTYDEVPERIDKLMQDLNNKSKKSKSAVIKVDELMKHIETIDGSKVIISRFENSDYKQAMNSIKNVALIVLFNVSDNKVVYNIKSNDKKYSAVKIVKEIANTLNGGGGGSDTFAQGGSSDATKVDAAIVNVKKLLEKS
jgi:alanyl-tRNA synthetase